MSDDEWSDDGYADRTAVAFKYEAAELEWFVTHYEAIQELYGAFRDAGEATFGNWFFHTLLKHEGLGQFENLTDK